MQGAASDRLKIAQALLDRLGITAEDLIEASRKARLPAPTFTEFVPVVAAAVSPGTAQVYGTYWHKVVERWGERRLDEITPAEVSELAQRCKDTVAKRRNGRGGDSAAEHLIAALRCLYRKAAADDLIPASCNPALKVPKPRRQPAYAGRVLSDRELAKITRIASNTGDDPDLDVLLLRLHREAACTRGEALGLHPADLDVQRCLILLHANTADARSQPLSPSLVWALQQHMTDRPGAADQGLLRYRDGRPITYRRYDHLWQRLGDHLSWVAAEQISTGWLRQATLDRVKQAFGVGVAEAYMRSDRARAATAQASGPAVPGLPEVAAALAWLTGEPHPLAG